MKLDWLEKFFKVVFGIILWVPSFIIGFIAGLFSKKK